LYSEESNMSDWNANPKRYLYWVEPERFPEIKTQLTSAGYKLSSTRSTPCQVLHATGNRVIYAPPSVWSRVCVRQGSWYRASRRDGQFMFMSGSPLPEPFEEFLDAELTATDFEPESLPGEDELQRLADSKEYQEGKPDAWEKAGLKDALLFKILFTFTRFWGWGDNLKKHWIGHRANHANFLARHHVTEIDGEEVPFSVTGSERVCSSCAEVFNVVADDSRKLVNACPGAVTFGGADADTWVDVKPTGRLAKALEAK
jgi:hypothetical protein